MAEKKYYWLKLKRDFFKRHDMRIIEGMPNGKDYILFYLKMLLESIDHEGRLRFNETIPYNEEMLSVITNTNVDVVKAAMNLFIQLGMVEILEDSTIYMNEVQKMIGSETSAAERMRKKREREKLPEPSEMPALESAKRNNVQNCYGDVQNRYTEIEKEKDRDIDKKKVSKKAKSESFDSIIDSYTSDQELRNALLEFIKMRQRIKKPMTNYALTLLTKKLDKLATSEKMKLDILNQSIVKGWQDLYPLKSDGKQQANDDRFYTPNDRKEIGASFNFDFD